MRFGANEKTPVGKSLEKGIPIQSHRRWVTAVHERAIHFYTKNHAPAFVFINSKPL